MFYRSPGRKCFSFEEPDRYSFSVYAGPNHLPDDIRILYTDESSHYIEREAYIDLGMFRRKTTPEDQQLFRYQGLEDSLLRQFICRVDVSSSKASIRRLPSLPFDLLLFIMKVIIEPRPDQADMDWPQNLVNAGLVCHIWWQAASSLLSTNLFGKMGSPKYAKSSDFLLKYLKSRDPAYCNTTSIVQTRMSDFINWHYRSEAPHSLKVSANLVEIVNICHPVLTYLHIFNVHHSVGQKLCQALDNFLNLQYICWDVLRRGKTCLRLMRWDMKWAERR
jgi:hypothetical protein